MGLDFLYTAISWVLLRWHSLFTAIGLDPKGGLNWALSIVFLVITVRLLMFRFFLKQVQYQRRMMEMQPKIKKLQEKYKGDRAALNREMMKLQQEGFNPISGCLPMFLQIPVLISLFHVLKHLANATLPGYPEAGLTLYTFTAEQTLNAGHAKLFGAPLAFSVFAGADRLAQLGGDLTAARITTAILVIVSALATFITQRTVMANQTTPPEGQAALIQKLALVGIPISVLVSGLFFPLGVLIYWFTSNLWTMGQQFYIHRFHPHVPATTAPSAPLAEGGGVALAPKVGAKPQRPRKGAPASLSSASDGTASSASAPETKDDSVPGSTSPDGPSKPAAGQRPAGNRPPQRRAPGKKRR